MSKPYWQRQQEEKEQRKKEVAIAQAMVDKEQQYNKTMGFQNKEIQKKAAIKSMSAAKDAPVSVDTGVSSASKAGVTAAMQGGGTGDIAKSVMVSQVGEGIAKATQAGSFKAGLAAMNPWVLGGAAAIGLLSAAEKRKQRQRQAEGEALAEKAKGKESEAAIYQSLSKSIQGILG